MIERSLSVAHAAFETLKEHESLVKIVSAGMEGMRPKGYFLIIGDNMTQYRWAVTEAELVMLRDELNKDFPADQFMP